MDDFIIVHCSVIRTRKDTCMQGKEDEERSTCTYPWSEGKDVYMCAMRQKKMTMTLPNTVVKRFFGSQSWISGSQGTPMLSVVEVDIEVN